MFIPLQHKQRVEYNCADQHGGRECVYRGRDEAVWVAGEHEEHPGAIWTDGPRLEAGEVGGAFFYFDGGHWPTSHHLTHDRRAPWRDRPRGRTLQTWTSGGRRRSLLRVPTRWRGVGFYMGTHQEAYDAERYAIVRGPNHLASSYGRVEHYSLHRFLGRHTEALERRPGSRTGRGKGDH